MQLFLKKQLLASNLNDSVTQRSGMTIPVQHLNAKASVSPNCGES